MTEQQIKLRPCPFCGGAAGIGKPLVLKRKGDFSIICKECGFERGDFNEFAHAKRCWDTRYFSDEDINMILSSEGRNIHRDKPGFPKIPFIFFWLSGFIFSFAAYLGDSSVLADSLNVFGFFTLLFTIGSALYWADLMRVFDECEETSISKETA